MHKHRRLACQYVCILVDSLVSRSSLSHISVCASSTAFQRSYQWRCKIHSCSGEGNRTEASQSRRIYHSCSQYILAAPRYSKCLDCVNASLHAWRGDEHRYLVLPKISRRHIAPRSIPISRMLVDGSRVPRAVCIEFRHFCPLFFWLWRFSSRNRRELRR